MIVAIVALAVTMAEADTVPEWERLFDQGVKLSAAGEWQAACELFERSFELDPAPGGGVIGNLADCREKRGKPAAAWRLWIDASKRWKKQGHEQRAKYARERAQSVARLATTVVIAVPEPDASGLALTLNGARLEPAAEIREVVDPGELEIVATLPGRPRFVHKHRGAAGDTIDVAVMFRGELPEPPPPPLRPDRRRPRIRIAIGVGAAAVASLGTGLALALVGNSRYDASAKVHCDLQNPARSCDEIGVAELAKAQRLANIGSGFAIVGGVLAVTSLVLVITAPGAGSRSISRGTMKLTPIATSRTAGLSLSARF